jgi:hypothetical protein
MFAILAKLGKSPMFWNSVYDTKVAIPQGSVVHSYQVHIGVVICRCGTCVVTCRCGTCVVQ